MVSSFAAIAISLAIPCYHGPAGKPTCWCHTVLDSVASEAPPEAPALPSPAWVEATSEFSSMLSRIRLAKPATWQLWDGMQGITAQMTLYGGQVACRLVHIMSPQPRPCADQGRQNHRTREAVCGLVF